MPNWIDEEADIHCIWSWPSTRMVIKKTVFNSEEYGVVVINYSAEEEPEREV